MRYIPKLKQRNKVTTSRTSANELVVLAYKEVLGKSIQLLSSVAAVGIIVSVLGWLRSIAYYDSFSASWMLVDLPFSELISRGIYPFSALLIGLLISFMDVAKLAANEVRTALKFNVFLFLFELVAFFYFDSIGKYELATGIANIVLFASASCEMLLFGEIVLELRQSKFKLNSQQIWYVITALVSFGGIVMLLGGSEGNRDKIPATSTLAYVAIADTTDDWRLLTTRNENLYLVRLTDTSPVLKIIKADKAEMVSPHRISVKENLDKQEPQANTLLKSK